MKKSNQILSLTMLSVASLTIQSCGNQEQKSDDVKTEIHQEKGEMEEMDSYACPMHPEVTGKQGDKCTKCGMALTPINGADHSEHEH